MVGLKTPSFINEFRCLPNGGTTVKTVECSANGPTEWAVSRLASTETAGATTVIFDEFTKRFCPAAQSTPNRPGSEAFGFSLV